MYSLINQLVTSTIRQALPSAPAVKQLLTAVKRAVFWTVLTAMLSAAFMGISAYGVYIVLLMQGVLPMTALMITAVLLGLVVVIAALIARQQAEKIGDIDLYPAPSADSDETLQVLLKAFLEGMTKDQQSPDPYEAAAQPAPDATVAPAGHEVRPETTGQGNVRKIDGTFT